MTETQTISPNQAVHYNNHASFHADLKQDKSPSPKRNKQSATPKHQSFSPLTLYKNSGEISSQQPAARGNTIDIII